MERILNFYKKNTNLIQNLIHQMILTKW